MGGIRRQEYGLFVGNYGFTNQKNCLDLFGGFDHVHSIPMTVAPPWPPWPWAFEGQRLGQVHLAMLLGQKIISPQISPCVPCALAAGLTWLKTGSKDGINMSSIMIHQH